MLRLVWNIDPVLLQIGPLQLHWYGLLFAAGILAAYRAGVWSFEQAGGTREEASRLLGYVVVGTVVGARLGHCLLYEPVYYLRHPLEILAVWRGGLASHGGGSGDRGRGVALRSAHGAARVVASGSGRGSGTGGRRVHPGRKFLQLRNRRASE